MRGTMIVALISMLGIAAGIVLYGCGGRRTFWRYAMLGLPMIAALGIVLWFMLTNPQRFISNPLNPPGTKWTCETYGIGARVCFKQQSSALLQHSSHR